MRQAISKTGRNNFSRLRVIANDERKTSELKQLVDTAWSFAYTALWNTETFSTKEISIAKQFIESCLHTADREKAFISFCQRVLLARQYVTKTRGRYIPLPSIWLDSNNKLGFAGTESWFKKINTVRESLPGYKEEIKAMAEAVLELSKEPSANNYQYWRTYFIDHRSPGLLQLFQLNASQQIYNH